MTVTPNLWFNSPTDELPVLPPESQQLTRLVREPARVRPRSLQKPGLLPLVLPFVVALVLSNFLFFGEVTVLGVFTTFFWALPIGSTLIGMYGLFRTRRHIGDIEYDDDLKGMPNKLIVLAPTVGRKDTFPGLRRAVWSFAHSMVPYFPNVRIDIAIEAPFTKKITKTTGWGPWKKTHVVGKELVPGCEAEAEILALAQAVNARYPNAVRVVEVPSKDTWMPPNGTRFKARANHYMHEKRIEENETGGDVWILHMDDDTGTDVDTARAVAQFIRDNPPTKPGALHLGQGVLSYPHQNATNKLTWLADAVRPGDDLARFAAFTGGGTPRAGVHGELFLMRASVEAELGWDYGPNTIVEDAQFALYFCERYPGRSGWFAGRCYGATPDNIGDMLKQRERWASGLLGLVFNSTVRLRDRIFMGYCMIGWVLGMFQHITTVLLAGLLMGNMNTSPLHRSVLLLWGCNIGFTIWTYWEGLKVNSRVSGWRSPKWRHRLALLPLLPVFSMIEALGGTRGLYKFVTGAVDFKVIGKNA